MDLRAESAPMLGMPLAAECTVAVRPQRPSDADAQEEADAAFAELFADAARQSNIPATLHSQPPPAPYADDTEIFDSGGLGYVENLEQSAALADSIGAEELDSAEFEIVMDDDSQSAPSVAGDASRRSTRRSPPRSAPASWDDSLAARKSRPRSSPTRPVPYASARRVGSEEQTARVRARGTRTMRSAASPQRRSFAIRAKPSRRSASLAA